MLRLDVHATRRGRLAAAPGLTSSTTTSGAREQVATVHGLPVGRTAPVCRRGTPAGCAGTRQTKTGIGALVAAILGHTGEPRPRCRPLTSSRYPRTALRARRLMWAVPWSAHSGAEPRAGA